MREAPVLHAGQGWLCHHHHPPQAALAGQIFTESHFLLKHFSAIPRVVSFNIHIHGFSVLAGVYFTLT